jgi:hypothetical protein
VTMRQNAMSSLRASATIIFVLRAAAGPSVRTRVTGANFRAEGESEAEKCDSSYE